MEHFEILTQEISDEIDNLSKFINKKIENSILNTQ